MNNKLPSLGFIAGIIAIAIALILCFIKVDEGQVAVVKFLNKGNRVIQPGAALKLPLIETVEKYSTYENLIVLNDLDSTSLEQLTVGVNLKVSYRFNADDYIKVLSDYGPQNHIENVIIKPSVIMTTKSVTGQYLTPDLVNKRPAVALQIKERLEKMFEGYPFEIITVSIDNYQMPRAYLDRAQAKAEQREKTEMERYELQRQNLISQRNINAAQAEAQAIALRSQATAKEIILIGEAEAKRAELLAAVIKDNPQLAYLEMVKVLGSKWNGQLPSYVASSPPSLIKGLSDLK